MYILPSPRPRRLLAALSVIGLLSILAIAFLRQGSVEMASATEPARKGTPEMEAGPEGFLRPVEGSEEKAKTGSDPWKDSQVQQPADLTKELLDAKSKKPLIVCVGFKFLYRNARITGALFHGPAGKAEGLENLKKWAQNVPRTQPIVLYCGCCPWKHCPNIRPAFKALHDLGFARLKILFLETDFASDWVQKGFPVQKGG